MVQVPKALAPEPYKSPIAGPLSPEQRDDLQPVGPGPTRSPAMAIPDPTPLRVGTISEPQDFVTMRARRTEVLGNPMQSPAGNTRSQESELMVKIMTAINEVSAENGSDTPDFILAEYLVACLGAFDRAVSYRDRWYGRGVATQAEGPASATYPTDEGGCSGAQSPRPSSGPDHPAQSLAAPPQSGAGIAGRHRTP